MDGATNTDPALSTDNPCSRWDRSLVNDEDSDVIEVRLSGAAMRALWEAMDKTTGVALDSVVDAAVRGHFCVDDR